MRMRKVGIRGGGPPEVSFGGGRAPSCPGKLYTEGREGGEAHSRKPQELCLSSGRSSKGGVKKDRRLRRASKLLKSKMYRGPRESGPGEGLRVHAQAKHQG